MRIDIPDLVLQNNAIPASAKLIYGVVYKVQRENEKLPGICNLTVQQIADAVGVHRATAEANLESLVKWHLIECTEGKSCRGRLQYLWKALPIRGTRMGQSLSTEETETQQEVEIQEEKQDENSLMSWAK